MKPGWAGRAHGVGRIADGPGAALSAGVHHEEGVTRGRAQEVLLRQISTAAIADELHHAAVTFAAGREMNQPLTSWPPKPRKLTSNISNTW